MIETGIFALLTGNANISAIVGTRVYPGNLPEPPVLPAISHRLVGGNSDPTFDTSGLQRQRREFNCHAGTDDAALALRAVLIQEMNGYRGVLSDGTVLQNMDLVQSMDFFDEDPRQFRCMVEFYLYFTFA